MPDASPACTGKLTLKKIIIILRFWVDVRRTFISRIRVKEGEMNVSKATENI